MNAGVIHTRHGKLEEDLLLDVLEYVLIVIGVGVKGVSSLGEDLGEPPSEVTATEIEPFGGTRIIVRKAAVDGDNVGDTVTRVKHDTIGSARGVQGEDSLDGDVHRRRVEGFKHDLGHIFPVVLGVADSLGQENGLLPWGNFELVVEGVMPDILHIVPIGHDAVLDGVPVA